MRTIATTAIGVILIAVAIWRRPPQADDFAPFYRAATLASAHTSVYADPSSAPGSAVDGRFLPYLRPPSYAALLRPLAAIPYTLARRIWIAALILATLACVALCPPGRRRYFALALAFSFPLADALMVGQDIPFVLLIAMAAVAVFTSGREFLAGLAASLLAIKPTYLPAVGLVLLLKSKRATAGLALGLAVQLAASFAVGGSVWPSEYLAILRNPLLDPEPATMLSIHEIVTALHAPPAVYTIAAIALYVLLVWVCRRLPLADCLAVALAVAVIAAPHCKVYDGVVLVPLFVAVASRKSATGLLACFALTPVLYIVVLMGTVPVMAAGVATVIAAALLATLRLYRLRTRQTAIQQPA